MAFGWAGSTVDRYTHWIASRHDLNTMYRNALDFYLWQPGQAKTAFGNNHVMSITGSGLAIGSNVWIVPTGFIMKVGGNVQIDGNLECEKIDVKNIAADFVFEEGYKRPNLYELEQFIKQNKHLPGIPPASVTKEGVDLGELTSILLQKVEELTLSPLIKTKRSKNCRSSFLKHQTTNFKKIADYENI